MDDAGTVVAEVVRERLDQNYREDTNGDDIIHVQSIFGAKTGLPLVDFRYGFEHFTLDVDQARDHALNVLRCAEAASQDAGVYRWLTLSDLGLPERAAAEAIRDLRRYRGDAEKEDWRTPEQQSSDQQASP